MTDDIDRFLELKEQYQEKYKDSNVSDDILFPLVWYRLDDFKLRADLLYEALSQNVLLSELEKIRELEEMDSRVRFVQNMEKSLDKYRGNI